MADDLKQTGKADDTRINVEQDHEVKYWSEKFGVSRDELRSAERRPDGEGRSGARAPPSLSKAGGPPP